ncbi:lysylphosphatidylglycerol synthase transmembrane domain-containing protein [Streptomyces sp. NPDC059761]|uniref:lysylphosphatidylglycerol synthase transmembrane domain-containing protein n=1 Tax=Streptomyces sp. NPDC059761 TaxID=3346937 RepID=UPI00365A0E19
MSWSRLGGCAANVPHPSGARKDHPELDRSCNGHDHPHSPVVRPTRRKRPSIQVYARRELVGVSLVITLWGMDPGHLRAAFKVADWRWLAVAGLANVASQVTRAVGWNTMFTDSRIRFPLLVRIEFAVQVAAAVSPEGVGEFVRVGYLLREGVARSVTVTLMMVRTFFSSLVLAPFLVFIWWPAGNVPGWAVAVAWVYPAVLTMLSVLIVRVARTPSAPAREGRLRKIMVSNILPTLPGQLGTFEAAVPGATAGALGQAEGLAFALLLHAQQVLPQIAGGHRHGRQLWRDFWLPTDPMDRCASFASRTTAPRANAWRSAAGAESVGPAPGSPRSASSRA